MRGRVTAGAVIAALVGLAALLAPSAFAESSPSAFGSRLVTLVNQARAQHGLRALTVAGGTSTVAAGWTQHLAEQQALSHNPDLASQLESHGSPDWTTYAENVATGSPPSADAMFQDYMNSPEHRDNILDGHFRYIGVGVVFTGSTAWNTLDFVDQYAGSTSPSTTTQSTSTQTTTTKPSTTQPSTTKTSTTTTTATKTTTHTAAPRIAARPAARTVVVPHRATHAAPRPRAVVHRPLVHSQTVALPVAPAAPRLVTAPSPVALTTPDHGTGGHGNAPLLVALSMLLVVAVRLGLALVLRRR
jgi:hypothetical protein